VRRLRRGARSARHAYWFPLVLLTLLAAVLPALARAAALHWLSAFWPGDLTIRGTFPFLIVAAGLWVLAWAERSRGLGIVALAYTATAVLASLYDIENVLFRLGWHPSPDQWKLTSLPNVALPALVLLVAGAAAFGFQRRQRSVQ
jgi:hypothetical protein